MSRKPLPNGARSCLLASDPTRGAPPNGEYGTHGASYLRFCSLDRLHPNLDQATINSPSKQTQSRPTGGDEILSVFHELTVDS